MFIGMAFATAALMIFSSKQMFLRLMNVMGLLVLTLSGLMTVRKVFVWGPVNSVFDFFYWDALSALLLLVIVIVADYAVLFSLKYMEHEVARGEISADRLKWYYFWLWLFIGAMLLVVSTPNLGILWIGIEGTTLATTLLVGFYRKKQAIEAAWKYVILCTVGISFALLGTLLLYAASTALVGPGLAALDIRVLRDAVPRLDPAFVRLGYLFAFVGFGTKVGFVPMHAWLPDAHSQAPSPVSALLSGVLLNCALYSLLRWHSLVRHTALGPDFSGQLLILFGILSLAVMSAFILLQQDVKRLLAYSSVEHMGILALGFGLGTPLSVWGASLHLVLHALTKSSLFVLVGRIVQKAGTRQILKIRGLFGLWPYSAFILLLGLLAITGTPPFGTFQSELSILLGFFNAGHPVLGTMIILFLTIVFIGFLYHFQGMLYGEPLERFERGEGKGVLILSVPLLVVLLLGIILPESIDQALNQVVNVILGG